MSKKKSNVKSHSALCFGCLLALQNEACEQLSSQQLLVVKYLQITMYILILEPHSLCHKEVSSTRTFVWFHYIQTWVGLLRSFIFNFVSPGYFSLYPLSPPRLPHTYSPCHRWCCIVTVTDMNRSLVCILQSTAKGIRVGCAKQVVHIKTTGKREKICMREDTFLLQGYLIFFIIIIYLLISF